MLVPVKVHDPDRYGEKDDKYDMNNLRVRSSQLQARDTPKNVCQVLPYVHGTIGVTEVNPSDQDRRWDRRHSWRARRRRICHGAQYLNPREELRLLSNLVGIVLCESALSSAYCLITIGWSALLQSCSGRTNLLRDVLHRVKTGLWAVTCVTAYMCQL
jgi:hypothetical protein